MAERKNWELKAGGIVRGAMVQRGITYRELVGRLAALGVCEDEKSLRNKVSQGQFSAVFFLQCCTALELRRLVIEAYEEE